MTDDEDEDPFERLGDVEREGDPFERLDGPDDASEGEADRPTDDDQPSPAGDGVDEPHSSRSAAGDATQPDDSPERLPGDQPAEDPFERLDRGTNRVRDAASSGAASGNEASSDTATVDSAASADPFADMAQPSGDPFGGGDSVFEQVDVGNVDTDSVWDTITDDGESDAETEPITPEDSRYAEVSKHAFCEQCEFFSEPPDAHCTHETAELIEYLDMGRVRLRDCPIVAEREDLE